MRIDHAFFALAKVDSTRALWLVRLLAENLIVRSVRKIVKSDSAVFDDHSLCLTRLSLFWSANQLLHLIYQIDRLWRNENRLKIKFICFVFDSIALWTWSILDFYDQLTSWLKHQIRWTTIWVFIVQNSARSSTILCRIFHNCHGLVSFIWSGDRYQEELVNEIKRREFISFHNSFFLSHFFDLLLLITK
jgi:hypothetical protein